MRTQRSLPSALIGCVLSLQLGCSATETGSLSDAGSAGDQGAATSDGAAAVTNFSFFVTSLKAMQDLSKSQVGFGGDLRFGETGAGAGLRGAPRRAATARRDAGPAARRVPRRAS